jgi:hypothetical protein
MFGVPKVKVPPLLVMVWEMVRPLKVVADEVAKVIALVYWKEILLSATEALPFLATLALFISVTLMLWSIPHIYERQKRYI